MKPVALPYPDTLNTLGDHVRTKRLDWGLRQKDVARQLGVKTETVTNWEQNYTSPQLYLIPRVIAFLGYDPVLSDSASLSLVERVVHSRKLRGMTQKDLARQLGVDPSTLAHWEYSRRRPMPENRQLLLVEHERFSPQVRGPKRLAVDYGPEFISMALDSWANRKGLALEPSRLGKHIDIAFVKSLYGHFREQSLDQHSFETLAEGRELIEAGRVEYNYERPHSAQGQQTPATFVVDWVALEHAAD